jgi:eukaryotic-like serine/threonine-protein kinase
MARGPAGGGAEPSSVPGVVVTLLAGRYRLEERLSDQGGSSVWKATDESLARTVTIRTFAPEFGRTGAAVAAARSAAQLSDPRLVQIFDADDRGEQPYIVTEWPGGERLDEVLAVGLLEPVRAAEIIMEAAEGLAVAHAVGLAHLCLTPDLLWWNRWGEVKISGVGTAAVLAGAEADQPAAVDTRGLASLLYAALTGYWPGPEQTGLASAPRTGDRPDSPAQVRPGISSHLDAVTCRALFGEANSYGPPILSPAGLVAALTPLAHPGESTQPLSSLADQTRSLAPVPPLTRPFSPIPRASAAAPAPPATPPPTDDGGSAAALLPFPWLSEAPADAPVSAPNPAAGPPADTPAPPPPAAGSATDGPPSAPAAAPGLPAEPSPTRAWPPPSGAPAPVAQPVTESAGPTAEPASTAAVPAPPPPTGASGPMTPQGPAPPSLPARSAAWSRAVVSGLARRRASLPQLPAPAAKPVRAGLVVLILLGSALGGWLFGHHGGSHPGPAPATGSSGTVPQSRVLRPIGATAFDPYGSGQNAQLARLAIDASAATAWHTEWYTSARFGHLKPGTGLLIDMGRRVTITSARIMLGSAHGAGFQLRVGATATSLARMRVAAHAAGVGGRVNLRLARPAQGRYVLIWFTRLPPDGSGTFEASVYTVRLDGYRSPHRRAAV